jgi:hypothetical protein
MSWLLKYRQGQDDEEEEEESADDHFSLEDRGCRTKDGRGKQDAPPSQRNFRIDRIGEWEDPPHAGREKGLDESILSVGAASLDECVSSSKLSLRIADGGSETQA